MRWLLSIAWASIAALALAQEPPVPTAPGKIVLKVIEAGTGRPLEGATVWVRSVEETEWRPPDTDEAWKLFLDDLLGADPEDRLKTLGQSFRTDAGGFLVLPAQDGFAEIGARQGKLWGSTFVVPPGKDQPLPGGGPQVLELRPDRVVQVQVVDPAGKPMAGVPVFLASTDVDPVALESRGPGHVRRTREPDGIALFRNLDLPVAGTEGPGLQAFVRLPCCEPVPVNVKPAAGAGSPSRIPAPACGAVTLAVVAPDGQPFTGVAVAWLHVPRPPRPDDITFADASAELFEWMEDLVLVQNCVARFPFVGLHERIVAEVRSPAGTFLEARIEIPGPRAAGEKVAVKIIFGRRAAVLTGRILDARKAPVAGLELAARLAGPSAGQRRQGRFHQSMVTTDAEGRFRLVLAGAPDTLQSARLSLAILEPAGKGVQRHRDLGDLPLPEPLREGENDVGVLHLPDEPMIVAGRVVDEDGKPVSGAMVAIEREEDGRWWREFDVDGETDEKGRFRIRGAVEGGALRLVVHADAHFLRKPQPFERGAGDVEVAVVRGGGIEGRILTEESLDAGDIEVLVQGLPARNHGFWYDEREDHLTVHVREGRFSCWNLAEGVATLRVRRKDQSQDLAVIERVSIAKGIRCDDPRVETIDLRGGVRACRIAVKAPDGPAIMNGAVCARPAGSKKNWERLFLHGATSVTLAGGTAPWEVRVVVQGFRVARLDGVDGDREVLLEKAKPAPVTVALPADFPMPEPPVFVEVQLDWLRPPDEDWTEGAYWQRPENGLYGSVAFDKKREATLQATEPGVYRLILWSKEVHGNSSGGLGLDHAPDREFVIQDGSEGARLEVRPDLEQLRNFIERSKNK